jgi:excisionase family DNA binding protein
METITNPFAQIDFRLKSIEQTLLVLASKEQPQAEKKYYSIAEAAKKLNVAQITLYRNVQAGKIPAKKVGSRLMILGSFVDEQ